MSKEELENIFKELDVAFNEGIQYLENNDKYPRIVFFEYRWESISASGKSYDTIVQYQVSFLSTQPRDGKLIELNKKLALLNLHPIIFHEYLKEKHIWHSYFSLDVEENICS